MKMIKQKISLTSRISGNKIQLRLPSGASLTFSREEPEALYHDFALTQVECAQLEAEGYDISPGSAAYASKPKKAKKKKAEPEKDATSSQDIGKTEEIEE